MEVRLSAMKVGICRETGRSVQSGFKKTKVVGADKSADVALLKLNKLPAQIFVAKLGDSDK